MKIKLLFIITIIIAAHQVVLAQESILPDISEAYVDKLIAVAKENYPRVKQNEARIKAAKANVGRAGISYLDAFSVSYVYQPKTSTVIAGTVVQSQFNGFQAGVFFNPGTFFEKPFAVREAKEELQIANDDQAEYLLTLADNVKKSYYAYIASIGNLKLQTQACLDANNTFNDVKHKFEKGEITFDNYSQAQSALTASYQAKIQAEAAMLTAKADLEELLGEKLEDIK